MSRRHWGLVVPSSATSVMIPSMFHQLSLGRALLGHLNNLDRLVKHYIKMWLRLPNDCVNVYLHAKVEDGGLGVPALRYFEPILRYTRLSSFRSLAIYDHTCLMSDTSCDFVRLELDKIKSSLLVEGIYILSRDKLNQLYRRRLYNSIDGLGLSESDPFLKFQHQ